MKSIWLVISCHYMGMDGDYTYIEGAYLCKEAAERFKNRQEQHCEHEGDAYDMMWYELQEQPVKD